jgi:cyclopropane fatty-acyl-phospholipid synthase-like methyltransferase
LAAESEVFDAIASNLNLSQHLSFEWSLRIDPNHVQPRDKVICWINNHDNSAHVEMIAMNQLLSALNCPSPLLNRQKEISLDAILNQGFGFSSSGKADYCLYLHYREGDTLRNRYVAFPWFDSDDSEKDTGGLEYEFHYLPMTPYGDTPDKWIHPTLLSIYQQLLRSPRLTSMSGFWLRKNNRQIDQISLTYSWQPPVQEFIDDISLLVVDAQVKAELKRYREHHLRHIAFNSSLSPIPTITLYFSSNVRGNLPNNFDEVQHLVKDQARQQHQSIEERWFKKISIVPAQKNEKLDRFYSTEVVAAWQQILGKDMYYHFGIFTSEDDIQQDIWNDKPFERAVEELTAFIAPQSRVYDLGCGWGGVGRYLIQQLECRIVGITISQTQYQYCHSIGIQTRYGDMESTIPPGYFDNLLFLESFEHVKDKYALLKKLRYFGSRLIIRMSCQDGHADNIVFGGSMIMISSTQLEKLLAASGWKIIHWRNRRAESLPSIKIWNARMATIPKQNDSHFETWRAYCEKIQLYPEAWAEAHPLIEVVAE